ncbi:MAG: tryptophan--tRNA ligase [Patescibacteria group bacterium]
MKKPVIVSGIQPTGPLHLGNYLGALKNWVEIQNSGRYDCFFFVADYHSLTENYDPEEKRGQVLELISDYLATGLDDKKSTIFVQSQVPECTELAWIFNTVTPVAELERMTQFKDKASRQIKNINMGLFDYPVLQAADILLYHGELVPVGQDQVQHVELTRDAARWFNNKYKVKYFPESKPLLTPTPKLMSLLEPEKKMSKSLGDKHWIGIDETPESIAVKIGKAASTPTGIENLKSIYDSFAQNMRGEFNPAKMAETKKIISRGIADHFADFRKKKAELIKNKKLISAVMAEGREKASAIAQKTLKEVKEIIGVM